MNKSRMEIQGERKMNKMRKTELILIIAGD